MSFESSTRKGVRIAVVGMAVVGLLAAPSAASPDPRLKATDVVTGRQAGSTTEVIATGLDNPTKMTIGPDGALYVVETGRGGAGPCAPAPGGGEACFGTTGAVTRIADGRQARVLTGLPSLAGGDGTFATGPVSLAVTRDTLEVLVQTAPDGRPLPADFAAGSAPLGQLVSAARSSTSPSWRLGPNFASYEAANNPDKGAGADPDDPASPLESNPYAILPYLDGYAVVDAAANDLLFVDRRGVISVLAVFPTQRGTIPAGLFGNPEPIEIDVQSVPTSVALGPDGALYVGELTGIPYSKGTARVWRVLPGQAPTVHLSGFTNIIDLGFDQQGRLLVLQISKEGLLAESPGSLIRVERDGTRTELAGDLVLPGGFAVGRDGSIYVSNFSTFPGESAGDGPTGSVIRIPTTATNPYRLSASDGGVFTFGGTGFYGSTGNITLKEPVVGMEANPLRPGYWLVASDGGVFSFGDAPFHGSTGDLKLSKPVVGMAATPDGRGYWLVASDGGVFAFGNARFFGSTGNLTLNKPIVGMAPAPDGKGYRLFASDGGVFVFGSAEFFGSTGNLTLNQPIVGGAATEDGKGYWLVASDGGVFAFGSAPFVGSTGDLTLNSPIVSITPTRDNRGYSLVAADGGVFSFGTSTFHGSTGSIKLNQPIVGSDEG